MSGLRCTGFDTPLILQRDFFVWQSNVIFLTISYNGGVHLAMRRVVLLAAHEVRLINVLALGAPTSREQNWGRSSQRRNSPRPRPQTLIDRRRPQRTAKMVNIPVS